MTRNELILSLVVCVGLGIASGLVVIWGDLSQGGVIAVVAVGACLAGLLAGQISVRIDRRKRGRVHQPR